MDVARERKFNLTGAPLVAYRKLKFIAEENSMTDNPGIKTFFFFIGCFFFSFRSVHPDI